MNHIKNTKNLETTIDDVRNFAHSYLEKYSPSKQQLRIYLFKKIIKINQKKSSKKELFNLIDSIISSLVNQKLLSDKYYSDAKSKAFLKRGYSLNKIRYNLIKKGINEKYIKDSIAYIAYCDGNDIFKNGFCNVDIFITVVAISSWWMAKKNIVYFDIVSRRVRDFRRSL